jgi:putative hydrolase of HD superfamily
MLSTLIELQRLKNLDRTGWTLRGRPAGTESVAAHSFGVCLAAMMLADELAARGMMVNVERLLRMALLHDWAEARIGDLPKTATNYFGAEVRKRTETAAFADIANGSDNGATLYRELYEEYEQRASVESRLVKAADVIDLLVQALALERAGARGLDEFWDVAREGDFQLEGVAEELVREILESLLAARATHTKDLNSVKETSAK